jgi:hypothetical protein
VIYHTLANREGYGRFALLFGARSLRDLLFALELEKWRGQFDVEVTLDAASSDWRGNVDLLEPAGGRNKMISSIAKTCRTALCTSIAIGFLFNLGFSQKKEKKVQPAQPPGAEQTDVLRISPVPYESYSQATS